MSKKQGKKEAKAAKAAARAEARRRQRQQTLFTAVVIAVIVVIGGVVIAVSLEDPADDVADLPSELASAGPTEDPLAGVEPCDPEEAPELEEKDTYEEAPTAELAEGDDYAAVIETTCGEVVVDLYEDRAPETVANFVGLAEDGFYDGLTFFRNARSIFALQTGSGTNEAAFDIGYEFADELGAAEEEGYTAGSLAMANSGPDTNGSQVFFVYGESPLPPAYTKFGQVDAAGIEVLRSIGAIPNEAPDDPTNEVPSTPAAIVSITVESGPAVDDAGTEATDDATDDAPVEESTD